MRPRILILYFSPEERCIEVGVGDDWTYNWLRRPKVVSVIAKTVSHFLDMKMCRDPRIDQAALPIGSTSPRQVAAALEAGLSFAFPGEMVTVAVAPDGSALN